MVYGDTTDGREKSNSTSSNNSSTGGASPLKPQGISKPSTGPVLIKKQSSGEENWDDDFGDEAPAKRLEVPTIPIQASKPNVSIRERNHIWIQQPLGLLGLEVISAVRV